MGWATRQAELNAPVGADEHGFSYRSIEGSKVGCKAGCAPAPGAGQRCLIHHPGGRQPGSNQHSSACVCFPGAVFNERRACPGALLSSRQVHKAWRDCYGEPYGEGDVIGCLLHLPEGGRPFELTAEGEGAVLPAMCRNAKQHAMLGGVPWRRQRPLLCSSQRQLAMC